MEKVIGILERELRELPILCEIEDEGLKKYVEEIASEIKETIKILKKMK
ncbi:hypothetical protein SCORR_v1c04610 [Spiroplasma corruscae]|uniref:Uncharacterized protein n=1 Tax=Spiroplasma corruscae TaxID=216934 RepID=A0A222EPL2_9MOLU|nr:hypothetical protein [Spiroplasma corruscae]ASP28233.1 hypothetical protein SCORR_v1c04610 [Spiroplasma corruscae]